MKQIKKKSSSKKFVMNNKYLVWALYNKKCKIELKSKIKNK